MVEPENSPPRKKKVGEDFFALCVLLPRGGTKKRGEIITFSVESTGNIPSKAQQQGEEGQPDKLYEIFGFLFAQVAQDGSKVITIRPGIQLSESFPSLKYS